MKYENHSNSDKDRPREVFFHCLSGAVLKWIAIVTMLIDHFAVAVYKPALRNDFAIRPALEQYYDIMRDTGRIAFPIFIFLLTEGYKHTKNNGRYLLRLVIFAKLLRLYEKHGTLNLFCWCFPKRCHSETIKEYIIERTKR